MGGRKDLITAGLTLGALAGAAAKAKGKMSAIIATESGAVASFPDGTDAPVADLTAAIVPVQSGSGDPSPENIRPISGWAECKVTRAGANLFDADEWIKLGVNSKKYAVGDNCTVTVNENDLSGISNRLITLAPNIVYSFYKDNRFSDIRVYNSSGMNIAITDRFTVPADGKVAIKFYASTYPTTGQFAFVVGTTPPSDLTPYIGDTYTVTFGSAGTVYGGTLDVTTGKLTVTMASVDLGTLDYFKTGASSNPVFSTSTIPNIKPNASSSSLANAICSAYKQVNYAGLTADGTFCVIWAASSAAGKVYFKNMAYDDDDAAAFKAAMSGVQLVYELATPIVYNLTPVEIRTLAGQNAIWADTGDVTVKYTADTKAFIDNYIAARRNG